MRTLQIVGVPWIRRPTETEGGYAEIILKPGWKIVSAVAIEFGVSLILEKEQP